jgi:hypothetical protein
MINGTLTVDLTYGVCRAVQLENTIGRLNIGTLTFSAANSQAVVTSTSVDGSTSGTLTRTNAEFFASADRFPSLTAHLLKEQHR